LEGKPRFYDWDGNRLGSQQRSGFWLNRRGIEDGLTNYSSRGTGYDS